MASTTGDLLEQLLFDIAITGSRGLGADEINTTIQYHYEHHYLTSSTSAPHEAEGALTTVAQPLVNPPDLADFTNSVWQQIEEHLDLNVEGDEGQAGNDDDRPAANGADPTKSATMFVYASEERMWQAIAGHEVDHTRLSAKLWEILEVIAAAGPEGILQPEARRLSGQDKQTVPLRTDQLADRGYITKERAFVPKMITSRLRHWRFADDSNGTTEPAADSFDHNTCFNTLTDLLKSNNGIATMKDIQLETGCTEVHNRKQLARCVARLVKAGMLRKVMAKVEGEKLIKGTDRFARCLQLLREPNNFDRDTVLGRGGPVKLDKHGRTKKQLWIAKGKRKAATSSRRDPESDATEDEAEQDYGDDDNEIEEAEQGVSEKYQDDDAAAAAESNDHAEALREQHVEVTVPDEATRPNYDDARLLESQGTNPGVTVNAAPANRTNDETESPRPTKRRRISSAKQAESADTTQSIQQPAVSTPSRPRTDVTPGVSFRAPSPHKRKRGRPRKSLIAVIKSDRLIDQPWFQGEAASAHISRPPAAYFSSPAQQVIDPALQPAESGTLSERSLDHIKRRQRVRAESLTDFPQLASQHAAVPISPAKKTSPRVLEGPVAGETPEAPRTTAAGEGSGQTGQPRTSGHPQTQPRNESQSLVVRLDGQNNVPGPGIPPVTQAGQVQPLFETATPSKQVLAQRRRRERERAAQLAASQISRDETPTSHGTTSISRPPYYQRTTLEGSLEPETSAASSTHETTSTGQLPYFVDAPKPKSDLHGDDSAGNITPADGPAQAPPPREETVQANEVPVVSSLHAAPNFTSGRGLKSSSELSGIDEADLPEIRLVLFEDEEYANAPTTWTPHKRVITHGNKHSTHQERCSLVLDLIRKCGRVFPGSREIWYPFVTEWQQRHGGTSDVRTVSRTVETLRKEGRLRKFEFDWTTPSDGVVKTFDMLTDSDIDGSSPLLKDTQKKMIDALPRQYMPPEVSIAAGMRRNRRPAGRVLTAKRSLNDVDARNDEDDDNDAYSTQATKRQKTSAEELVDPTYIDVDDSNDASHEETPATREHDWRNNFSQIEGATVKRTAAGLEHADAEAQRLGFADANARVKAKAELGAETCRNLQRVALHEGHLISAEQLPTKRLETTKSRSGWPKGGKRKQSKPGHGDDVAHLLSLLFYPQQVSSRHNGTIGIFTNVPGEKKYASHAPKRAAHAPKPAIVESRASSSSKKRSADETSTDSSSFTSILLLAPGQSYLEPSGTFGTNSIAATDSHQEQKGRGKRVKTSTEKGARLGTIQAALDSALGPVSVPSPTPALTSKKKSHLLDDPDGTVSTEYKNAHPDETWYHRGRGRWARAPKASAYSKSIAVDDPDGTVSTDYVNSHPNETWWHRGHGRWVRGLPPEGSSYKTAVKGPEAKAYLARIGTLEGKSKKHGAVVDGMQLKLNGEPWKRQPITVNGVRINPTEAASTPSAAASQQYRFASFSGVAPVQYEAPAPTPPHPQPPANGGVLTSNVNPILAPTPSQYVADRSLVPHFPVQPQPQLNFPLPGQSTPTPAQSTPPPTAGKRKRPYTYKSRKQSSALDANGLPIEIDRESDEDYTQTRSPKRQRKQSLVNASPVRTKHSIDRKQLSTAIALVKNLSPAATVKDVRWDLVALALKMDDKGAAAEQQSRGITNSAKHAGFLASVEKHMQEPFLTALEEGQLSHIDLAGLESIEWPALLQWAEQEVVPMVDEKLSKVQNDVDTAPNKQKTVAAQDKKRSANEQKGKGQEVKKVSKISNATLGSKTVFPAAYNLVSSDAVSDLDLKKGLITAKSWIRANSATKDAVYDTGKATGKLAALGTSIVQAVEEMQQTQTIRQLKKGRQRPGRNFEITQHVWDQFRRWPGDGGADAKGYLREIQTIRQELLGHFIENESLEVSTALPEQTSAVLTAMIAQGLLKMEVRLPPRNDDIDAPYPKLNAWSYCGPTHDTRSVKRTHFDLPVVYSKTDAFSTQHHLRSDVPLPGLPKALPDEPLPRVPFWIDINGDVISDVWEKVLSSIIYVLVRRPGITVAGIEKAHENKLWAWEIELAFEWMSMVGLAERFGHGRGWTVGEEWYCAFAPDVATWA